MLPAIKIGDTISVWQWRGENPAFFEAIATSEPYWFDEIDQIPAICYSFEGIKHYAILMSKDELTKGINFEGETNHGSQLTENSICAIDGEY